MAVPDDDTIYAECIYNSLTEWLSANGPRFYHLVASRWNWDEGIEILDWIISRDDCDAGTAQAVFWLAEPYFYSDSERKEDGSFGVNDKPYRLVLKIARLWEQGFYKKWAYSEATKDDYPIRPIVGTRVINDELTVPAGLDEKRHGAEQDLPSSSTLSTEGVTFNEGIPDSIWRKCLAATGEEPFEIGAGDGSSDSEPSRSKWAAFFFSAARDGFG